MHENDPPAEYRATVRIDAQPGGKKFQGVWLEFDTHQQWVIAYRPHELWRGFAGEAVIVTGQCYEPFGQAIGATHFRVERMRLAPAVKFLAPLLEVGPESLVTGDFVDRAWPAGSKRAGEMQLVFRAADGTSYEIAGSNIALSARGAVKIRARNVEVNRAHAATTGGPHLWILDVHDANDTPDEDTRDKPIPCP